MRVALIATSLRLAGAEKQFAYAARALVRAGFGVRVFHLGEEDYYQKVLRRAGVPVQQILNPNRPLMILLRLGFALQKFRPDIVLASQFGDLVYAIPAGRACRAFVLGGVRSDGFYELRTSGRRSGWMLRGAHGFIANSQRAKANLVSAGLCATKINVLPNVIDLEEFDRCAAMPASESLPPDRVLIAAVGSLLECKRLDRFLEALAQARQREPSIYGVIAGRDLGLRLVLERKATELGLLPGHILFAGETPNVAALLKRCRSLALCSDYEGFPNVILEAMAAALPVVTTPVGDAARIVENGATGYVVPAEDTAGIAEAMMRLARDPQMAGRLGQAARKRAELEYNYAHLPSRLLAVLSEFARWHGRRPLLQLLRRLHGTEVFPAGSLSVSV